MRSSTKASILPKPGAPAQQTNSSRKWKQNIGHEQYQVEITEEAEQDFAEIKAYIVNQFEDYVAADNIGWKIAERVRMLAIAPFAGAIIESDGLHVEGLRSVHIKHYRIFYYVDESAERVVVVRIMYGRRDFTKLLQ